MIQREPKLSFKLYSFIQSDCHLSSHDFHSYNSTTITSYLSSNIRFNAKSTSKDLYSYNSTRSQAIFQAIFNSMLNQLAKISARNVSTRTMTTSNTVIKAESKSIFNSFDVIQFLPFYWYHMMKTIVLRIYRTVKVWGTYLKN